MRMLLGIIALYASLGCTSTDEQQSFSPPPDRLFTPLGEWAESGGYSFRIVKVEETTFLALTSETINAPRGTRFVTITVDVLPLKSDKDSVNYLEAVSLVDMEGEGYVASRERFLKANGGKLMVIIEPGRFVERTVPFLVPKDFKPAALRCVGGKDSEPYWLALRRN